MDHCKATIEEFANSSNSIMADAAEAAIKKLEGYYSIHSEHSILSVVLDPRFKMALFEQRPLDADHEDRGENSQIRFKDKALKTLRTVWYS